ncbi:MAG: hypothetical protein ACYC2X_00745 [Coriobacteriia bacterium]
MKTNTSLLLHRLTRLAIALLIIGVIASDAFEVVPAVSNASDAMNAAMAAALAAASVAPDVQDSGYQAAVDAAAGFGGTIEAYSQRTGEARGSRAVVVTISASAPVGRTLVAAPVLGIINGLPASEWYAPTGMKVMFSETKRVDVY